MSTAIEFEKHSFCLFDVLLIVKGPEAVIQEAGLDFGLVKLGEVGQSFVMLDNISNLPLNWSLVCLDNKVD